MEIRINATDIRNYFERVAIGENDVEHEVGVTLLHQFIHEIVAGCYFYNIRIAEIELDMQLQSFSDHAVIVCDQDLWYLTRAHGNHLMIVTVPFTTRCSVEPISL